MTERPALLARLVAVLGDRPAVRAVGDALLDRYDEYATAVRQEYVAVDDEAFRTGRAAVLRALSAGSGSTRRRWPGSAGSS